VMEDLGQVSLMFEGGLPATILSGRLGAPGRVIELDITGTKGAVRACSDADGVTVQGEALRRETYGRNPAELMVHDFLRCLEQGKASPIPAEDGLACVRILQAAYESARTGSVVNLDRAD